MTPCARPTCLGPEPRHPRTLRCVATLAGVALLAASACSSSEEATRPAPTPSTTGAPSTVPDRSGDALAATTVFRSGTDGYSTFRIPAIVATAGGDLLAFAEGRVSTAADDGDVDLVMRRSTDDGATWGEVQVVADDGSDFIGNPSPVLDPETGRIVLLAVTKDGDDTEIEILTGTGEDSSRPVVLTSDDEGRSWSDPVDITEQAKRADWRWYAIGPGHAISLRTGEHAGRLVAAANHSHPSDGYGAHVLISDDGGQTWEIGGVDTPPLGSDRHPNESMAAELADGTIVFTSRDQDGADRWTRLQTTSSDGATTFDQPYDDVVGLVAPVVQASLLWLERESDDGLLVMAAPSDPEDRRDLRLRTSADGGATWSDGALVGPGPAAYSDLVALPGGALGVLFETGEDEPAEVITFATLGRDLVDRA